MTSAWSVLAEMAPYLWIGFGAAGVLSVWLPPRLVERHLGGAGLLPVVKASLFGIPIPLCSCGVIPVATSLRRQGASRGATISFLTSTPQTGVDSILVTWSLLGPVFTVYRVIVAFVSGLLCGTAVDVLQRGDDPTPEAAPGGRCCSKGGEHTAPWRRAVRYGFLTLPAEIGISLAVGILISAILSTLIPGALWAERIGGPLPQILVAMVAGIPFYVCSTGSVPVALGLVAAGLSPGAAMAFLVTGPATNAATVTTVATVLGKKTAIVYLVSILGCAFAAGLLAHAWVPAAPIRSHVAAHAGHLSAFDHAAALALLLLIAAAVARARLGGRKRRPGGSAGPAHMCQPG